MQTKRVLMLIAIAALSAVVFILHWIADLYYLYWVYWWYDIMMHFLTGCAVGGLAAWGALRFKGTLPWRDVAITTFIAVMVIGIGWEIFEYLTGQYKGQESIVIDTAMDLILDALGALATAFVLYKITVTKETSDPTLPV